MKRMFYLQIADARTGDVARFMDRPMEVDFVDACMALAKKKGVGFLKTEDASLTAMREAMDETIYSLKVRTKDLV